MKLFKAGSGGKGRTRLHIILGHCAANYDGLMDRKGSSKKGSPPQQNGFLGSILVCRRVTSHSFQESFFPANNISGQPTGVCTWQRLTRITNQPRELSSYCDTHTPHLTLHLVGCCWTSGTRVFWSNPKGDHRETERQIYFVSSSREKSPIFKTQNSSYLKNTCCCLQACCFEGKAREITAILGSRFPLRCPTRTPGRRIWSPGRRPRGRLPHGPQRQGGLPGTLVLSQ